MTSDTQFQPYVVHDPILVFEIHVGNSRLNTEIFFKKWCGTTKWKIVKQLTGVKKKTGNSRKKNLLLIPCFVHSRYKFQFSYSNWGPAKYFHETTWSYNTLKTSCSINKLIWLNFQNDLADIWHWILTFKRLKKLFIPVENDKQHCLFEDRDQRPWSKTL